MCVLRTKPHRFLLGRLQATKFSHGSSVVFVGGTKINIFESILGDDWVGRSLIYGFVKIAEKLHG